MSAIGRFIERIAPKARTASPSSLNASKTVWKGTEYTIKEPTDVITSLTTRFGVSKEYASNLVKHRQCLRNNKPVLKGSTKVHPRDVIHLPFKLLQFVEDKRDDEVQVLYKDDELLFINKPPSLAVHSGHKVERGDTLQEWLDRNFVECGKERPFMLHRLDKEASGVLMLALTKESATKWSKVISETLADPTRILKKYWTINIGEPEVRRNKITSLIYEGKVWPMTSHALDRKDLLDEGKVAISEYHHATTYIRKTKNPNHRVRLSLLEWTMRTGRKHQLRVHCQEQLKNPILGDTKYSKHENWNLAHKLGGTLKPNVIKELVQRLHLHCKSILLKDYLGQGRDLVVEAPIPQHWVNTMRTIPAFWRVRPRHPRGK